MYQAQQATGQQHSIPKCTFCGTITEWKLAPVIRPMDWIITIILFFFFGSGLIYLLIVAAIRSNPNNREKICPNCNAHNLWTFIY